MTTLTVSCQGKRHTAKLLPMEPLQRLIEQIVAKLKPMPEVSACTLLVNGKPADLSSPLRFANIPSTAKLEVLTGQQPSLGVQEHLSDARQSNPQTTHRSTNGAALDSGPSNRAATDLLTSSSREPRESASASHQYRQQDAVKESSEAAPVAEPFMRLGLDREIAVFTRSDLEATAPHSRSEDTSDDFYDFGPDDYAAVMSGYKASQSRAEAGLKTGKLRERDQLAWAEKFPETHVRIFMPDGHIVQAKFRTLDTVATVKEAVRRCLCEDVARGKWYLYTTPPKEVLKSGDATLLQAKLYPAANLHLGAGDNSSRVLRAELEALRSVVPSLQKQQPQQKQSQKFEPTIPPETQSASRAPGPAKSDKSTTPKWLKLSK